MRWFLMFTILMLNTTIIAQEEVTYGNPDLLAEAEWVQENLADIRVIDLRPIEEYNEGHIPGAVQLNVGDVRATVDGVRLQVADAETVAEVMRERGISPEDTIIIYDDANLLDASLLFWTLEYYQFEDVRLLNGGWANWEFETSTETPDITPIEYPLEADPDVVVDADWVLEHLEDESAVLIDARNPDEFSGKVANAAHGGHIPGAFNLDWRQNLEDNFFKSQEELMALYEAMGLEDAEIIVTYCQTGHRASVAYFTLRLMGYENVRVYDGSWLEWGNRDDLPYER